VTFECTLIDFLHEKIMNIFIWLSRYVQIELGVIRKKTTQSANESNKARLPEPTKYYSSLKQRPCYKLYLAYM